MEQDFAEQIIAAFAPAIARDPSLQEDVDALAAEVSEQPPYLVQLVRPHWEVTLSQPEDCRFRTKEQAVECLEGIRVDFDIARSLLALS